jgi:hypothetical protein
LVIRPVEICDKLLELTRLRERRGNLIGIARASMDDDDTSRAYVG